MKRFALFILFIPIFTLISHPIEDLLDASKKGDTKRIESILKKGKVDVNGFLKGSLPTEEEEVEEGFEFTPLHWAAKNNHLEAAKILLQYGASINAKGGYSRVTPVFLVLHPKKQELLRLFIAAKGDLAVTDSSGQTVLNAAVRKGYFETIKLLIEAGLDVNHPGAGGETPLHEASADGYDEIVEFLIANGASLNLKTHKTSNLNSGGNTSLHYAALFGKLHAAKILLKHGADKNIKNGDGEMAVDIAKRKNYSDLVKLLK